jgi:hypothetical protein
MWGCRGGIMRKIKLSERILQWVSQSNSNYNFGVDQDFLARVIYPIVINYSMEHSEFNLKFGGEIRLFPTIRNNYEFVGDVFDENNERHPEYWKLIN